MCRNFCISNIEQISCIILSKGSYCIRMESLCEDKEIDKVRCCKNKIQIFLMPMDINMHCLQYDHASYRILVWIKTIDITGKFEIKSGLFWREVYPNNKQTNCKISNWSNDPLFKTLARWCTGKYKAFSQLCASFVLKVCLAVFLWWSWKL